MNLLEALSQTWPARMGQAAWNAATLPGDVVAGKFDTQPTVPGMWSDADESRAQLNSNEALNRVADLAGLLVGTPGGAGGLGSGARLSFTERMAAGKDLAMDRYNRGAAPGAAYGYASDRYVAPAGTFDRFAQEQRAGWNGDKQSALDAYRTATGTAPESKMLLAPGESLDDMINGFTLGSGAQDNRTAAIMQGIRAYHGSPYDFDKFDLSKIGTGEGAQAYGHGLYFAENPAVAADYKKRLAPGNSDLVKPDEASFGPYKARWEQLSKQVRSVYDEQTKAFQSGDVELAKRLQEKYSAAQNEMDALHANMVDDTISRNPHLLNGRMYEVNIKADPQQFLDWDKQLAEQPPHVQRAIEGEFGKSVTKLANEVNQGLDGRWYTLQNGEAVGNINGWPDQGTAHEALKIIQQARLPMRRAGEWLHSGPNYEARLNEAGIPGIKYLDQGSRTYDVVERGGQFQPQHNASGNTGPYFQNRADAQDWVSRHLTNNYVVFNPDIIDILKKYGLAGLGVTGAASGALAPPQQQAPIF